MTKITVRENHLFDNCTGIEDPINVHGTFQQVVAVSEDRRELTVRYMHRETAVRWKALRDTVIRFREAVPGGSGSKYLCGGKHHLRSGG